MDSVDISVDICVDMVEIDLLLLLIHNEHIIFFTFSFHIRWL